MWRPALLAMLHPETIRLPFNAAGGAQPQSRPPIHSVSTAASAPPHVTSPRRRDTFKESHARDSA